MLYVVICSINMSRNKYYITCDPTSRLMRTYRVHWKHEVSSNIQSEKEGNTKEKVTHTFKSPEMLAPARMPVAEGKKMENIPKKLPSGPRQLGTKLVAKMPAVVVSESMRLMEEYKRLDTLQS